MSGPYRFTHESAKSPLDRTQGPFSANQPVSYKTNVNRAKTKKWVTAKKNAYDGDDWGEYDEYDEYGVDQEPPPPEPASSRYYAQPQRTHTDRSFTEPQGPPGKARRNSFEAGEEHRAFSASIPQPDYGQQEYDGPSQPEPQSHRDFSPSAMPPPLQTRVSAMPADVVSPSGGSFPPRKSSIGQSDSPLATSPRSNTGPSAEKPLPFIRPADIYRRVEEERERERASMESSRPSLDSLTSRPKDDLQSPTIETGKSLKPLETVAERKSEYLPDFNVAVPPPSSQQIAPASNISAVSPPKDEGFRSFVDQAFVRTDDQRSIPPTPISKDSGTDISRSNTDSTSGISPIMSRVPSSATSALKRSQAAGEGSTPVIAEETHEPATTVSGPTPISALSAHETTPKAISKPFPDHTRNISSSSLPRSGLATPTRGDSPARSPVIAPQKNLPEPEAAHLSNGSPNKSDPMQGGLNGPSSAYAGREADIASAVKGAPGSAAPGLIAAEKDSQDAFLESHHAQDTIDDAVARSRSESPSKGRVQALASTFGEVSSSRRGSTQSNGSRHSIQSWERSHDNSRAASPTKGSPTKPRSPVKEFRPHLPGQWESYATTATAVTPSDQGDREPVFGVGANRELDHQDEVELTPTTTKFPVKQVKQDDTIDPLAALKSAGAAMAASLGATVGLNQSSNDKSQAQEKEQARGRPHGDLYMPRPLQLDRTASSLSSVPPTPPAKDTPVNEQPPPPPLKERDFQPAQSSSLAQQQQRPGLLPQLSTAPSAEDAESDRLRKEIVASLSPVRSLEPPTKGQDRLSIQSEGSETHRMSSVLPAEYDSYWADGGRKLSQDTEREVQVAVRPATPPSTQPPQLGLLNRFSWEANSPKLATPDSANRSVPVPEPVKQPAGDAVPPPIVAPVIQAESQKSAARGPSSYFGPEHTVIINEPGPATQSTHVPQSPKTPVDLTSLSSPTREQTRSPGLHVVNSADNPEAVDLPPRLSADLKSPIQASETSSEPQMDQTKDLPNPAVSTTAYHPDLSTIRPVDALEDAPVQPISAASPTSPTSDKAVKPRDGREIATINSASERILSYNKSRDQWATHDHGLEGWLSSALEANPELLTQSQPVMRPTSGTMRHKHTASLSMLGKFGGSSTNQAQNTEASVSGAPQPVMGGSPTAATQSGSGFDRRIASAQMQMKGKDFLHSAEKLSGKGLTSAKGLFAKGKSRFGREKVPSDSMPSSREASTEPAFLGGSATTTPEKSLAHTATDADSPRDDRRKRRFSISSFRRSSRSRSRPASIALPSNTSLYSSTPKGTPPRELSRILGEEKSRPHSYHAPDSWNVGPGPMPAHAHQGSATPPRENLQQARLGILPSPAKSAFSTNEQSYDHEAPPVPPIPASVRLSHDLSHEVLQSVIRYSTPPPANSISTGLQASPLPEVNLMPEGPREDSKYSNLPSSAAENELNSDSPPNSLQQFRLGLSRGNSGANVLESDRTHSASPEHLGSQAGLAVSTDEKTPELGAVAHEYDADDMPPQIVLATEPAAKFQRDSSHGSGQQERRNWETEIIGAGDVSPVSSRFREDEDVTPRGERASAASSPTPWFAQDNSKLPKIRKLVVEGNDADARREHEHALRLDEATSKLQPEAEYAQATLLAPADGNGHQPSRRVSASPLQVVHAVEEYAASDSSYASWDHNSTTARSISGSTQPSDMRDESDLVTPIAGVPRIVQNGQADRAEHSHANMKAAPNGFFAGNSDVSHSNTHSRQQSSDLNVPERSKSMLSMISSMVSEGGTPISPASSNAGRSTPSTIRRMQHEPSIRHATGPAQIPEDSVVNYNDTTLPAKADDFDLYADHDGVVKGLQDERGQPLRLGQPQTAGMTHATQSADVVAGASNVGQQRQNQDDQPRYSTERPMSFISGPPDQDGKPQDQINSQLNERVVASPDNVPHGGIPVYNAAPRTNGMVYSPPFPSQTASTNAPVQARQQAAPSTNAPQAPGPSHEPGNSNPAVSKTGDQHLPRPTGPTEQEARDPRQINGPPPIQNAIAGARPGTGMSDPRMQAPNIGQYGQQGVQGPGNHLMPDNDPRAQRNPIPGQPGPRNEYEFQQQMRQLQNQFPRPQGSGGSPMPPSASQQPVFVPPKQQEKSSSKPKFSSVFKGLGSKFQSTPQPETQVPHRPMQPNVPTHATAPHHPGGPAMASDPNRNGSFQSGVSSLHREQYGGKPDETQYSGRLVQQQVGLRPGEQAYSGQPGGQQPGGRPAERYLSGRPSEPSSQAPSTARPPSNGAESHFSGISHVSSTKVQPPTDSRLDLRKPLSPAPYQGIPPQQPPQGAPVQQMPRPTHAAGGPPPVIPETGKKKRFSTLGNFFGRSNDASSSKVKPGKEDKKAQKGMRHSTAPVMGPGGPQWPSQQPPQPGQQMYRPQPAIGAYGPGQFPQGHMHNAHHAAPQFASPQAMSPATPQSAQSLPPHLLHQHQQQQLQQRLPSGQQISGTMAEQGSAYMRTKQLADEHQARRLQQQPLQQDQSTHPGTHASSNSFTQQRQQQPQRQDMYGSPSGGYYKPDQVGAGPEQAAYATTQSRQSSAPQLPYVEPARGPVAGQQSLPVSSNYGASMPRTEQQLPPTNMPLDQHLHMQQQHYNQTRLYSPPQQAGGAQPQQGIPSNMQQSIPAGHRQDPHGRQMQGLVPDESRLRSVSGPMPPTSASYGQSVQPAISQRHVSSPQPEPRYETPQIPAAYSHVSGAFISPRDLEQEPLFASPQQQARSQYMPPQNVAPQINRQFSDSQMPNISPQISAQSQIPHGQRQHSDASTVSVISPITNPAYDVRDSSPAPQQVAKPRMSSISEVHQSQNERPWHLNFPEGATEQEIVRARQRQYMEQQFTAQQQAHAAKSPSPRMSTHSQSPAAQSAVLSEPQRQSGGFRELLPRSSPQPYAPVPAVQQARSADEAEHISSSRDLRPAEPAPIHFNQNIQPAAAYALPMSPDPLNASAASPVNPLAAALAPPPPPKPSHGPMRHDISQASTPLSQRSNPMENKNEDFGPRAAQSDAYVHGPSLQNANHDQQVPDEAPPSYSSYDSPKVAADGMDKSRPERTRPPNIVTDAQQSHTEGRPRQASIGLMQHPQPASMAASPQRSSADMGAANLRTQLLQQEELARMERIQRAQIQQAETERERQEREAARRRARELERSVSGGGRVGSIRSVTGSRNGGAPGWERRGSNSRPVFELPAVEDEEPAMRATSYPGQEWQPPVWIDD